MQNSNDIIFCKGGGCTAKLGPEVLAGVLAKLPQSKDPRLLVGFESSDDAAVYQLTEDLAVVTTLDFFPPMVDDPYTFGQIAAANSLSDVYAMGGDVITALNIVCFPESWDMNILGKILAGGSEKVREAGGILAGGHSITDTDIKYGLSVTGTINPRKIFTNNSCREGDKLILTKPLGVGIVCTANRVGEASEDAVNQAVRSMTALNKYASEIMRRYRVHACTDVTGFGLLGHLGEMLGLGFEAVIDTLEVPFIRESAEYANRFLLTAAAQRNRNHMEQFVEFNNVPFSMQEILYDAQTSGGLLISLDPQDAHAAFEEIEALGLPCGIIGTITEKKGMKIIVR